MRVAPEDTDFLGRPQRPTPLTEDLGRAESDRRDSRARPGHYEALQRDHPALPRESPRRREARRSHAATVRVQAPGEKIVY